MSSPAANISGSSYSASDLPSFEDWIRQKSGIITLPVVIALLNLALNLIWHSQGSLSSMELQLYSHVLQLLMVLALLFSVPKSFPSLKPELREALKATEEFRNAWLFTLVSWLSLYVIFTIEAVLRQKGYVAGQDQLKVLHVVEVTGNCFSTIGFWQCFITVSNPDQKGDPIKWVGIVLLIIGVECAGQLSGNNQALILGGDICVGALSGIAMSLFVGRLESRLLRPPRWILIAMYGYATAQFGYGFLGLELKSGIEWQPVFFMVVLLLKIVLALFVNWLVGTGNLLFYVRYMSELNHDYVARRDAFLLEVKSAD